MQTSWESKAGFALKFTALGLFLAGAFQWAVAFFGVGLLLGWLGKETAADKAEDAAFWQKHNSDMAAIRTRQTM